MKKCLILICLVICTVMSWNIYASESIQDYEKDTNASVVVTGLDDNNAVYINKYITICLKVREAREVKGVRLYNGRYLEGECELSEYGYIDGSKFIENLKFDDPGIYDIYALVTYESLPEGYDYSQDDNRIWYSTDKIVITVIKNGNAGAFDFHLGEKAENAYSIERGTTVPVTYGISENATHYWLEIEKQNEYGGWYQELQTTDIYVASDSGGNGILHTAGLEPGEYRICAFSEGDGYEPYQTEWVDLVITQQDDQEQRSVFLNVGYGEDHPIYKDDMIMISAFASGAKSIEVYYDYLNDRNWKDIWFGEGFGNSITPYSRAGSYNIVAIAKYPDGESVESDPVIVDVKSKGKVSIEKPVLPAFLNPDGNLSFNVESDCPFLYVNAGIQDLDYGSWWTDETLEWRSEKGTVSVLLDLSKLKPNGNDICVGQTLTLHCGGSKPGYDVNEWYARIPIVSPSEDGSLNISLTGLTDEGTVLIGHRFTVTVESQSDNPIKAVRLFDGESLREEVEVRKDGTFEVPLNTFNTGIYSIYALATYDELPEDQEDTRNWVSTDVVTVTVVANGSAGEFDFFLGDNEEDAYSIERGDVETIHYGMSDNATHYWLSIEKKDNYGGWVQLLNTSDIYTKDGATTNGMLHTAGLNPGIYRLCASAEGDGFTPYTTEWKILTITSPESTGHKVNLNVESDEENTIFRDETFVFSAFAPGAEYIKVHYNFSDSQGRTERREGEGFTDNYGVYHEAGTYTMVAVAYYAGGESVQSEPVVINVKTRGKIQIEKPILPKSLKPDGMLSFTIESDCSSLSAFARINNAWGEDSQDESFSYYSDNGKLTVTVDLSKMNSSEDVSNSGPMLSLSVSGVKPGYDVEGWQAVIPILSVIDDSLDITVSDSDLTDGGNVLVNQFITVKVETKSEKPIKYVRLYSGTGGWYVDPPEEDGTFTRRLSFNNPGNYTVYALVTYDPLEPNQEDTRNWVSTEVIELTVVKNGDVGGFDFFIGDNPKNSYFVKQGDTVPVTYGYSQNATHYWVNIYMKNSYGGWSQMHKSDIYTERDETRIGTLNTAGMKTGVYQISATAEADGYVPYTTKSVSLIITDPNDVLLELPAGLTEIEDEVFENDSSITHVIIPNGVKSIGDRAFLYCTNLKMVEIPSSVTSFGDDAFDFSNITIYGYSGSIAQSYASEHGISFVTLG